MASRLVSLPPSLPQRGADASVPVIRNPAFLRGRRDAALLSSRPALRHGFPLAWLFLGRAAGRLLCRIAWWSPETLLALARLLRLRQQPRWQRAARRLRWLVSYFAGARSSGMRLRAIAGNYSGRLRVLLYHAVLEDPSGAPCAAVSPAALRRQLGALRRLGFQFVSLEQWMEYRDRGKPLPRRAVALTFDDGYSAGSQQLKQVLSGAGAPASMFVVSSMLGDMNRWDLAGPRPRRALALMGPEDLRQLAPALTIGSHSRTHASLPKLPAPALREELAGSKQKLEESLDCAIRFVAYPYGDYARSVGRVARESGYELGLGVAPGINDLRTDRFLLQRIQILSHDTLPRFLARVLFPRFCDAVRRARFARRQPKTDPQIAQIPQILESRR